MTVAPDFTAWNRLRIPTPDGYHTAVVKKGRPRQNCIVRIHSVDDRKASVTIHFLDRVESRDYDLDDLNF